MTLSVLTSSVIAGNGEMVISYAQQSDVADPSELVGALSRLQQVSLTIGDSGSGLPYLDFGGSMPNVAVLTRLMDVDELPDGWRYSESEEVVLKRRAEEANLLLAKAVPKWHDSVAQLVGSLAMARRPGFNGGSNSSLIGVIWIGLPASCTSVELAELILHEFVHQALFLDDMVSGIFPFGEERMAQDDALVMTAILQRPRGYDKAFHSAYVATALAEMYRALESVELESKYRVPITRTLEEMWARTEFLTAHGVQLLEELTSHHELALK